jgi:hypothetical protein
VHSIKQRTDEPCALTVQGTPRELAGHVDQVGDLGSSPECVTFGGLIVTSTNTTAKHDGRAAIGFTLTDSMGQREVGRLTLRDMEDWREDLPEWELWFGAPDDAVRFLDAATAHARRPKVSSIMVDVVDGDNDELLAEWASDYGVSFRVANPSGPGGGHPEIEISGFTDRIEHWLREIYAADSDDVKLYLG